MRVTERLLFGFKQRHPVLLGVFERLVEIFVQVLFHHYFPDIVQQARAKRLLGVERHELLHFFCEKPAYERATCAVTPERGPVEERRLLFVREQVENSEAQHDCVDDLEPQDNHRVVDAGYGAWHAVERGVGKPQDFGRQREVLSHHKGDIACGARWIIDNVHNAGDDSRERRKVCNLFDFALQFLFRDHSLAFTT